MAMIQFYKYDHKTIETILNKNNRIDNLYR